MSTAYHPQTDGQSEVLNRCLEQYLRCMTSEQPKQWGRFLHWAEYWYNTSFQSAAGITPFQVVYRRVPPTLKQYLPGEFKVEAVAEEHNDRNEMLRQLRYHLENAQNKMAKAANTKRRELQFSEGDKVLLKLRPHRQSTIHHRINQKLAPRFYGPFTILQKYSAVSYKLALPDTAKVHPIFHVSQLRRVTGNHTAVTDLPKDMAVTEPGFDPQDILKARQQNGVHQVLVKWEGRPEEEATWIDVREDNSSDSNFGEEVAELRRLLEQPLAALRETDIPGLQRLDFLDRYLRLPFPHDNSLDAIQLNQRSRSNHKNTNCGPYFGSTLNLNTNNETDAAPNSKQFDLNVFSKFSHLFLHVAFEWNQ
nr:peroxidase 64 [Ipomoea batatas]